MTAFRKLFPNRPPRLCVKRNAHNHDDLAIECIDLGGKRAEAVVRGVCDRWPSRRLKTCSTESLIQASMSPCRTGTFSPGVTHRYVFIPGAVWIGFGGGRHDLHFLLHVKFVVAERKEINRLWTHSGRILQQYSIWVGSYDPKRSRILLCRSAGQIRWSISLDPAIGRIH